MGVMRGTCPMSGHAVVDEYFLENRTRVLDLAAFLDRLARARDDEGLTDFRVLALKEALQVLASHAEGKVARIQSILSDPSVALLPSLDRQNAWGACDPAMED